MNDGARPRSAEVRKRYKKGTRVLNQGRVREGKRRTVKSAKKPESRKESVRIGRGGKLQMVVQNLKKTCAGRKSAPKGRGKMEEQKSKERAVERGAERQSIVL